MENNIKYNGYIILAISVKNDGNTYATSDGRCLKRLGKNSKPFYPDEMSNRFSAIQSPDFSGQIIVESSIKDINQLEIYNLKEKIHDSNEIIRELCGYTRQQARSTIEKMLTEELITANGKGRGAKYYIKK